MNIKSLLARPFATFIRNKITKDSLNAINCQEAILQHLVKEARQTKFGKDHHFAEINNYTEFKSAVPVRDYEDLKPYINLMKEGRENVLWKGHPLYFAKTSGTTSGVKYIPISKDSIHNHIDSARNALLCYIDETGNDSFVNGKMIFLSGSPELTRVGGIPTGRLSGIVNHHVPNYLRRNQLPSFETNCIEDWETKLDQIVKETLTENMSLISGIPPWMQMYFDRLVEKTNKPVSEIFPNFNIMVQGGVNFEPYKPKLFDLIGKKIDYIELYPASEGFLAFQDSQKDEGLLLNINSGIFFEFIPLSEVFNTNPTRISLKDVKIGENYAVIINNNAGLWGYNIGDTVRFVSLNPYRILVTGRIKHFISAFGEHVIGEEVEYALSKTARETGVAITEFTVAPLITKNEGKSCHEWFIEFESQPDNMEEFIQKMNTTLMEKNIYYDDLIRGNILQPLKIVKIRRNGFIDYMKSIDRLGGQNKLPRLSNDRKIADALQPFYMDANNIN